MNSVKFRYVHIYIPITVLIWLGLFIDSVAVSTIVSYNQIIANVVVVFAYIVYFLMVPRHMKKIMLYAIVVAIIGETLFSLVLGMYTYRLDNIPLYVILGHALIYLATYYLAKEPVLWRNSEKIVHYLFAATVLYSSLWLVFAQDVLGFLLMLSLIIILRRYKQSRLFFLLMFFMVAYLELLGTYYRCWAWPNVWFDVVTFIPSANPPSGIGVMYFLFDAGCLWFYKYLNKRRWRLLRRVRK